MALSGTGSNPGGSRRPAPLVGAAYASLVAAYALASGALSVPSPSTGALTLFVALYFSFAVVAPLVAATAATDLWIRFGLRTPAVGLLAFSVAAPLVSRISTGTLGLYLLVAPAVVIAAAIAEYAVRAALGRLPRRLAPATERAGTFGLLAGGLYAAVYDWMIVPPRRDLPSPGSDPFLELGFDLYASCGLVLLAGVPVGLFVRDRLLGPLAVFSAYAYARLFVFDPPPGELDLLLLLWPAAFVPIAAVAAVERAVRRRFRVRDR